MRGTEARPIDASVIHPLSRETLVWYRRARRSFPWRGTRDPYRIWISEIMLQQTRTETVREYYPAFLARFSTLHDLARASLSDVLKAWEGLGYYGRARHLHAAAGQVDAAGGSLPRAGEEWIRLPGIGRYTAAAITAIAFGDRHLPLDANIRRVVQRTFDLERASDADLERAGAPLLAGLDRRRVPALVQALMDLGATVCLARRPRCEACPLTARCAARKAGTVDQRPRRERRAAPPHRVGVIACLRNHRDEWLLVHRPPQGLLGGLWELPGGSLRPGETPQRALRREMRAQFGLTGLRDLRAEGSVDHAYSHFSITLHLVRGRVLRENARPVRRASAAPSKRARDSSGAGPAEIRWVPFAAIARHALPAASHRAIARFRAVLSIDGGRARG